MKGFKALSSSMNLQNANLLMKETIAKCVIKNGYNRKIENSYIYNTTYVNESPDWTFPSM